MSRTGRDGKGRFKRERTTPWNPETWDDGYVDNRGRFRVYRPDFPGAYEGGYALRAHVVWWLAHTERHPHGTELHHKNENKCDDRLENLEPLTNSEHQLEHRGTRVNCAGCGIEFWRAPHRARYSRSFCTNECYQKVPRTAEHKAAQSRGQRRAYASGVRGARVGVAL